MAENDKKRAIVMAGGGVKVAFQAGVLQVWLDEAGIKFDLADGASGGVFNLAMYCQGMSGKQMADNWRTTEPVTGLDLNLGAYTKLFFAESLFEYDRWRENVFTHWGLDWKKIRASNVDATFNVYNFTKNQLELITPANMTEEMLVACVSLPMWFPPVKINGDLYIDPVWVTDANIEETIRRGADELWIIWTVSERGEWHGGFVNTYFQIIEACSNGDFRRELLRIERNNADFAAGRHSYYGRHIEVKLLKAEVPLHYLLNFTKDRMAEATNRGVERAREWCKENNIPLQADGDSYSTAIHEAKTSLQFTEEMKGYVDFGETDYDKGFRKGKKDNTFIMFHLTMKVDRVNTFIVQPKHEAASEGYVECEKLGGRLTVERGFFNLVIDEYDPQRKKMLYRLFFQDSDGNPITLSGFKDVKDDPGFDLWADTTTLFVRLYKGHVGPDEESNAEIVASGIMQIFFVDFMKLLTTFRTEGPSLADRTAALARFGRLFLGKLWDVYATEVLPSSPF